MTPERQSQDRWFVGEWFVTSTGRRVYVASPTVDDVCIEDIAHALSHLCRFGGHTQEFYSVAQHSVHVSELVPQEHALVGLMHDATEAYLGDVIRPLKREIGDQYRELEGRWWRAIAERFELPEELPDAVHVADVRALATERRDLIMRTDHPWKAEELMVPDPQTIRPWNPDLARTMFLLRFTELTPTRTRDTLPAIALDAAPDTQRYGDAP